MIISNRHLAIGIPLSFPTVPSSFFESFTLMEKPNYSLIMKTNGPIDTLRNDIVEKALDIGATHLLMCDTDQVYHPKTVTRLLSHNLPVVAALVHRRYPPFDGIMLKVEGEGYAIIEDYEEGSLVEVDATGAGCIMYDMSIFRKLPEPWFRFQKNPDNGMIIGEDVGLCQDLKTLGYRIFVDTSVGAGHLTTMIINRNTHMLYRSMKQKQNKEALERALQNDN